MPRQLKYPGGSAGPDMCEKHQVPIIHTITEQNYCAVCESARATEAEERVGELERERDEDEDKWTRYNDLYVEARHEIGDLRRLLRRLEWCYERDFLDDSLRFCPLCDKEQNEGHAEHCQLAKALADAAEARLATVPRGVVVERVIEAAKRVRDAHKSEWARGGEMWYAETVIEPVEELADAVDALEGGGEE